MELAGLAVAEAVFNCLPSKPTSSTDAVPDKRRVLVSTSGDISLLNSFAWSIIFVIEIRKANFDRASATHIIDCLRSWK